jgi:hypothetical protein
VGRKKKKKENPNLGSPLDATQSLEMLSLALRMPLWDAVRASLVKTSCDLLFVNRKEAFSTNPANTFTYTSLRAVEDASVVDVYETLRNENGVYSLPDGLKTTLDLKHHRHAISHPSSIRWDTPEMQAFADSHRKWTDVKVALLWDVHVALSDARVAASLPALETPPATWEMATMALTIMRYAMKPEAVSADLTEAVVLEGLQKLRGRWLSYLENQPGGRAGVVGRQRPGKAGDGEPPAS